MSQRIGRLNYILQTSRQMAPFYLINIQVLQNQPVPPSE